MSLYLLVKEHKVTGLKYLCKHEAQSLKDCVLYRGSGTYWKRHLKQNGNIVNTKCLFVTEDKDVFRKIAIKYSLEFDIVNSDKWANLTLEEGQGGNTVFDKIEHGKKTSFGLNKPIVKQKHLKHLSEHIKIIQPLAAKAAKEKLTGVKKSEQHRYNMCGERPHVNQTGSKNNNAKKIQTPFGIFYSISEASKNIQGYTYKMIWSRLNNVSGWRYI
jgi:hypothetical protein